MIWINTICEKQTAAVCQWKCLSTFDLLLTVIDIRELETDDQHHDHISNCMKSQNNKTFVYFEMESNIPHYVSDIL